MMDFAYVGVENAVEFFQKISLDDTSSKNFNFTAKKATKINAYPYNERKNRGNRRTAAKNRFRGQRDGTYSLRHENRAYNIRCKRKDRTNRSNSIIKRGLNEYLDDVEEKTEKEKNENKKHAFKDDILNEIKNIHNQINDLTFYKNNLLKIVEKLDS